MIPPSTASHSDPDLVTASLCGDREAFGQIVSRYQALICSLTYSATGSLGQSEDLAQETFLAAWKDLRLLREPEKLRSWLCGIAKNLSNQYLRRQHREPLRGAESMETIEEPPAIEPQPRDQTISKEEEAILWRSIEHIPELYREPLILFYRQNQSIETVAKNLELTEDAVKQRLSRGRKMLAETVTAFVEGALKGSAPNRAFLVGVLAALPILSTSASAATVAATAAQGSAVAKTSFALGTVGALAGPLVGVLGAWFGIKASLAHATSEQERQLIIRFIKIIAALVVAATIGMGLVVLSLLRPDVIHPSLSIAFAAVFFVAYVGVLMGLILRFNHQQRRLRAEFGEAATAPSIPQSTPYVSEYRSPYSLFGLPLLHIRRGREPDGKLRPAIGWIAIGEYAIGVLFAAGGFAIGGISMGGVTLGIISMGGIAVGALSLGGLALGIAPLGGISFGYIALGGCAIAWHAAMGGLAAAHDFALGGVAHARHANDLAANTLVRTHPFFHWGQSLTRHAQWLILLWIPWVFVMNAARRRARGAKSTLLAMLILVSLGATSSGVVPDVESASLPNGIRIISVSFRGSTDASIFTFTPMGLSADAAGRAQWSHLVEHMVIRSTIPANSPQANAETLADHMRLDFYGTNDNWKEGLQHHRRWLEGVPFTSDTLTAEKPKVAAECDFTARSFATHKFALAAWSQGLLHGTKHIALKGDVFRASLEDVQQYRDERLLVPGHVTVCIVSGLPSSEVLSEARRALGDVALRGKLPTPQRLSTHDMDLTWDLDARHLLLTWPLHDTTTKEDAALMSAMLALNMKLFADPGLKTLTGMILAGSDLTLPEGNFAYISASLRPGASVPDLVSKLTSIVDTLPEDPSLAFVGQQLGASLTTLPDLPNNPPGFSGSGSPSQIQANWALQYAMFEHRLGTRKQPLTNALKALSLGEIQTTLRKYLAPHSPNRCVLIPDEAAPDKK